MTLNAVGKYITKSIVHKRECNALYSGIHSHFGHWQSIAVWNISTDYGDWWNAIHALHVCIHAHLRYMITCTVLVGNVHIRRRTINVVHREIKTWNRYSYSIIYWILRFPWMFGYKPELDHKISVLLIFEFELSSM